jgi:hypothetical protein
MTARGKLWIAVSALTFALIGSALAADRVDLFDTKGRRTGYAIVDQESGRVDLYDVKSRRTGWGRLTPAGKIELFGLDGQRKDDAVIQRAPDRGKEGR